MAKGNDAKNLVITKIKEAFGENFICELDKKLYIWSKENGEPMQVAISLTCPKVPVGISNKPISADGYGLDFENMTPVIAQAPSIEFTEEEENTINTLMEKLNL